MALRGAFVSGEDYLCNKMIASLNLDGVALAAIQGPHQVMRRQMLQKDEEIAGLKQELKQSRRR